MEAEVSDPSSEDDSSQGHIRAPSQRGKSEDSLEPKQRSGVGIWASGCQCNDGTLPLERLLESLLDMKAQCPRL